MEFPLPPEENLLGGDTESDSDYSTPAQDIAAERESGPPPLPPPAIDPRHGLVELSEKMGGGGPPPPVLELMKSVSAELVEESSKKQEADAEAADDTKEDTTEAAGSLLGAAAQVKNRERHACGVWCVVCSVPSVPHRHSPPLHTPLFAHPPLCLPLHSRFPRSLESRSQSTTGLLSSTTGAGR
jgi:hypothetical protein